MSLNIRPFAKFLRANGYSKDYDSRAGGCRVVQYSSVVGERKVEVQLWEDGKHRATHWLGSRMSTYPTDFTDVAGMESAIRRELTRDDHPERAPIGMQP